MYKTRIFHARCPDDWNDGGFYLVSLPRVPGEDGRVREGSRITAVDFFKGDVERWAWQGKGAAASGAKRPTRDLF